jgi:hypothetical protein
LRPCFSFHGGLSLQALEIARNGYDRESATAFLVRHGTIARIGILFNIFSRVHQIQVIDPELRSGYFERIRIASAAPRQHLSIPNLRKRKFE